MTNLAGRAEPDKENDPDGHRKWDEERGIDAKKLAACTLGHFLRAAALTTPSGKQNSFASNCEPCAILVEIKDTKTPTSYANAFAEVARRIGDAPDDAPDCVSLVGRSIAQFGDHVFQMRQAYATDSTLFWHAVPLYRYPLQGWEREPDGRKAKMRNAKGEPTNTDKPPVQFATKTFVALGGKERKPEGLVEAVIDRLNLGFAWSHIKDAGKAPETEA